MKAKYRELLKEYRHSIPIIYSHIEKQYKYIIEYNEKENYGVLFTTFDYHYVFGKVPQDQNEFIQLLSNYVTENGKEELILFSPNDKWDKFLKEIFESINGVIDKRYQYQLNKDTFKEYDTTNSFVKLELKDDNASRIKYPQASIYINGNLISFSRAFMLGKNHAELDVWTDTRLRKKGFAFDSSLCLIEYLLENKITPNWSCWEMKESSRSLAEKLGYELEHKIPAYIWTKEFGEI